MENKVVLYGVEVLKRSFGGTEVEILDSDLSIMNGVLGVTISVGIGYSLPRHKVFFPYQYAEDMIAFPRLGEQFIFPIIKDDYLKLKNRMDRIEKLQRLSK